jgi:hypothetical protein
MVKRMKNKYFNGGIYSYMLLDTELKLYPDKEKKIKLNLMIGSSFGFIRLNRNNFN